MIYLPLVNLLYPPNEIYFLYFYYKKFLKNEFLKKYLLKNILILYSSLIHY